MEVRKMKPTVIFDVDGILLKRMSPNDIYGTLPDPMYFEMAREAMASGMRVVVLTGRTITDREDYAYMEMVFKNQNFRPDAIIPFPSSWRGTDNYVNWKLRWIEFIKPIAVIDDMAIFALGM